MNKDKKNRIVVFLFCIVTGVMESSAQNMVRVLKIYKSDTSTTSIPIADIDSMRIEMEEVPQNDPSGGSCSGGGCSDSGNDPGDDEEQEEQPHDWVDLDLPSGTLWATMNVGAQSPEEYGDYFAWGEIVPKERYDWVTYKWSGGSYDTMEKYCVHSDYGTIDGRNELLPEDDAAYVNWGRKWRTPSAEQQDELYEECSWTWTTLNGVWGYEVKSLRNENSMFLPAAGGYDGYASRYAGENGYYWSRTLNPVYSYLAMSMDFVTGKSYWYNYNRFYGQTVRPVRAKANRTEEE